MIRTGDTIFNPVTGERITFRATSADTNGEAVVIECAVKPDGFVAATHVHPSQSERFAVIEGTLGIKAGKEKQTLGRGEVAVVEPGTPHRFWNAGDEPCRILEIIAPGGFEKFFEEMVDAGVAGGPPDPEALAVLAGGYGLEFDYESIPGLCERFGLTFG